MSRFGSLGTQYFDNSGEPLINGLIYFYESGTTTLKTTYSDINQAIANTNPVVLTASGRQPNIFFTGAAKAVLATSANVIIETRDPVGQTDAGIAFSPYIATFDYPVGAYVTDSSGDAWASIATPNIGNEPSASPLFWEPAIDGLLAGQTVVGNGLIAIGNATTGLAGLPIGNPGEFVSVVSAVPPVLGYSAPVAITRVARTSNTIIAAADKFKLIDVTSGTFAQTFEDAATLGNGFYVHFKNSGTGTVTLTPDGAETIDGAATLAIGPNSELIVQSDGSNLNTVLRDTAASGSSNPLITTVTASAAATALLNSGIDSTYDEYDLLISGTVSDNAVDLSMRVELGGSVISTSTYMHGYIDGSTGGTSSWQTAGSSAMVAAIPVLSSIGNGATNAFQIAVRIVNPSSTTKVKQLWLTRSSNRTELRFSDGVAQNTGTAALTGIQIYPSAGTITCTMKLYGIKQA
jgi:hypothetical protein